jgi:hypothetical protein
MMASEAFGRLIAGPVGSGKTTACLMELVRRSVQQRAAVDGLRYTRFAIVRQTLKQLKDTVLKDCKAWLTASAPLGEWKVSEGVFHLNFDTVRSEWVFIPLEDAADQARLLSMQLTGAWLSEAIEMNLDVVAPVSGRCGRYPSGALGVPTWHGIIADTNMPTEMTPWHQFMENPPPNWQIFKQPSGLSPNAENLNWLLQKENTITLPIDHPARLAQGRKYYENFVNMYGEESDWVNRYVKGQYGNDPSGEAVFRASFQPNFHGVEETKVIPSYPLIVGQDFGRNPWSLICQPDHMGRLLVHEEVPAMNIGLEKHVNQNLKPRLWSSDYTGCKIALVGDPSGVAKGSIAEESCFDALKRFGLPAFPAPTNDIDPRLRAVETLLGQQRNGGPALLINKQKCPMLMRAMGGGYRFKKSPSGGLKPIPEKQDAEGFSHVADCLQYVALVVHGGMVGEIARRLQVRSQKRRAGVSSKAWT